ncbi:MAG: TrmB family transcriptional regulator [Candidatus Bathyarchaeia archaeon]
MERQINRVKFLLMNMGLNEYQASALSHLLYLGETKAATLSKASGVPHARIYGVLDELSKTGLVTIRPGRPALYSPMTPTDISSALITDAREEIRRRLNAIEEYSDDFASLAGEIFLKAKKVDARVPLLRIVSVGNVSLEETRKLYQGAKETLVIMTRAMEYFEEVAKELKEAVDRGVSVKILMMSGKRLYESDRRKRNDVIKRIKETLGDSVEIRVSDEVILRGCIVDSASEGRALFLVEEVGVPFFLREAAITSHPGVVKGLTSMFDLNWQFNTSSPVIK